MIAAIVPLLFNVTYTLHLGSFRPESIGVGASVGLLLGFATLLAITHMNRARWLAQG